tara:strand:+ start:335 stop:496 length:162 start_codon:yes stop_codon:yes gene_type:complete
MGENTGQFGRLILDCLALRQVFLPFSAARFIDTRVSVAETLRQLLGHIRISRL